MFGKLSYRHWFLYLVVTNEGGRPPVATDQEYIDVVEKLEMPTTSDVADAIGCDVSTASDHLSDLESEGCVSVRRIGPSKVWSVTE